MKSIVCGNLAAWVVVLLLATQAAVAGPFVDPLDKPAEASPLAQHSQLLAITRAGSRLVAAGMRGHILYSDDDGRTWIQAKVPVSVALTALSFPTPQQGWAAGHSGVVLHTGDGGQNWELQLDGRRTATDMIAFYEGLAGGGDEAAARLVQELPINWQDGPEQPWLGVRFADEQQGFVGGAFNLMLETRDGGRSWTPWTHRVDNPDALHLNAIEKIGSALYMPSERGVVFRLGRLLGVKGPGLFLLIPFIDRALRVELRGTGPEIGHRDRHRAGDGALQSFARVAHVDDLDRWVLRTAVVQPLGREPGGLSDDVGGRGQGHCGYTSIGSGDHGKDWSPANELFLLILQAPGGRACRSILSTVG